MDQRRQLLWISSKNTLPKQPSSRSVNSALRRIDVAKVVEDKINAMSVEELEKGVLTVMKTELRMIVNLGALIGLVIGSINIFI